MSVPNSMRKLLPIIVLILALPSLAAAYPGTSNSASNLGFDHPSTSGWDNANSTTRPISVDPNGNVNVVAPSGVSITVTAGSSDLCQNPSVVKSSIPINLAAAATTELIAAATNKTIFVCNFDATASGTSPTIQFKTGTKVTNPCDTNPVTLTGTFTPTTGTELGASFGGAVFASSVGGELCAVVGGTGPSIQGVLTFVQQ